MALAKKTADAFSFSNQRAISSDLVWEVDELQLASILLPHPPMYWNYRHKQTPSAAAQLVLFKQKINKSSSLYLA